jgi:thiamine biosynthesis lipoprotein
MNNKRLLSFLLLICILSSALFFPSCAEKKEKFVSYSLDYFDTVTTVTGYESDKESFDRICGEILGELGEYHRLFTIYHRFEGLENLYTINELKDGAHRVVSVDVRILEMLSYAKEMYRLTDGKLNIAMGSVLSIWHDYRTAGLDEPWAAELPPMEMLREAAEHTDIENLILDTENGTVWLADPKMTLDVGAIAKGYATEQVCLAMKDRGYTHFAANIGGNIRIIGKKPDGSGWGTGIKDPEDPETPSTPATPGSWPTSPPAVSCRPSPGCSPPARPSRRRRRRGCSRARCGPASPPP